MIFSALLFAAGAAALPQALEPRQGGQNTMLRFGCSQVIIDRIDPLVNPGLAPSPHMHQVNSLPSTRSLTQTWLTTRVGGWRQLFQHYDAIYRHRQNIDMYYLRVLR